MKIPIVLFPFVLFASTTLATTVAPLEVQKKHAREWKSAVSSRYDVSALDAFLKATITEIKIVRGFDIRKPKLDAGRFSDERGQLKFGEWSFLATDPRSDSFEFWVLFPTGKYGQFLRLQCIRNGPKSFRLVDTAVTDVDPFLCL